MDTAKLPNGAVMLTVDQNGGRICVKEANAYFPPRVAFLRGGRKTSLIPADLIERYARQLPHEYSTQLLALVKNLTGEK